ncbi:MAG: DNA repair protein RecN [Bacteroidales bacterium]|nr:DNA repair protein RecN [Bacteroidales bacterium]
MLLSLQVVNYVLIDSLETSFPEGLIIITGQTGAGKSILLGALSLLLGGKADASMVGPKGENCVVEGVFSVASDDEIRSILLSNDLEVSEKLTIRRVLGRSGRSRSFINDEPVTLGVLQELAGHLVDIHSQNQTLSLSDPSFRLRILDTFAGNAELLLAAGSAWEELQGLVRQREELASKLSRLSLEREYSEARFRRLDEAGLKEGELEELEEEQKRLAHAEDIKTHLYAAEQAFDSEEFSLVASLKDAEKQLLKASSFIPSLEELSSRLSSARLELEDIQEEISAQSSRVSVSPERLQAVEDRLFVLYDLMKRFDVRTIGELIAERDALSSELFDESALRDRLEDLDKSISKARQVYDKASASLHEARLKACKPLAGSIMSGLRFLELEKALFSVELTAAPEGPKGTDAVRLLFSSGGHSPVDVSKCASGGELSRIMLCLKAVMARNMAMPTMVFDEIDTGVSGSAADKMGSMICELGADMQVFAITHLPQVAAKGKAHYLVTKSDDVTSISRLDEEGRVGELARMLSGSVITEAAIANAKALLA